MVGPELSVEFGNGNGGVETTDWETDEITELVLDPIVYDVTVNDRDALVEPIEIEGEPLDRFAVPVDVIPDGTAVLLGIFVEFDMGNGTDVKLPAGTVELVIGPVGTGAELKDTGPGPVGTRLPVDPNIVGTVALDNGKGAEVLPALDVPVAPLESGNGTVDVEEILVSVRDPDATTLLSSILVNDAVDRVLMEPELEMETPELPAVGPWALVEFEVGKGAALEVVELDMLEVVVGEVKVDVDAPMLPPFEILWPDEPNFLEECYYLPSES
ncbi:hypothetical protein F4818DRAFT_444966 [Hypoxylon cercidicola]|nr:hypothetical protein F4818DRAFT_444966 [Hypoxylon cercidicola]